MLSAPVTCSGTLKIGVYAMVREIGIPQEEDVARGIVTVNVALSASVKQVWQALTEPENVSQWFGRLNSPLQPGVDNRLDFEDGDFFLLEMIKLDPPYRVAYNWRFLGLSPLNTIAWTITPQDVGCLVTVTDQEAGRSREEAESLKEGWLDFTQRLVQYVITGERSRYDWRREISGSVTLAVSQEYARSYLFAPKIQEQWLPLRLPVSPEDATLALPESAESSIMQPTDVHWATPLRVAFHLKQADWLNDTRCEITLLERQGHCLLCFDHSGWDAISQDPSYQLQQRKHFCALWIESLRRARHLIEQHRRTDE
jgi:uncharacterized protein YndB with AHSA1/START domain